MDTRTEKVLEIEEAISNFEERFQRILISKRKPQLQEGVSDCAPFPESHTFYSGRIPSITLTKDLQNTLILRELANNPQFRTGVPANEIANRGIPQSAKELSINFSREERLLLYNYCISATGRHSVPDVLFQEGSSTLGDPSASVTFADVAALQSKKNRKRNEKHRPSKSTKARYTDELRSLIDTQMSMWETFLKQKNKRQAFVKRLQ